MKTFNFILRGALLLVLAGCFCTCSKRESNIQLSDQQKLIQQFEQLYQAYRSVELGPTFPASSGKLADLKKRGDEQSARYLVELEKMFQGYAVTGRSYTKEEADALKAELKATIFDEDVLAFKESIMERAKPSSDLLDEMFLLTNGELGEYYPALKELPAFQCYAWLKENELLTGI